MYVFSISSNRLEQLISLAQLNGASESGEKESVACLVLWPHCCIIIVPCLSASVLTEVTHTGRHVRVDKRAYTNTLTQYTPFPLTPSPSPTTTGRHSRVGVRAYKNTLTQCHLTHPPPSPHTNTQTEGQTLMH